MCNHDLLEAEAKGNHVVDEQTKKPLLFGIEDVHHSRAGSMRGTRDSCAQNGTTQVDEGFEASCLPDGR